MMKRLMAALLALMLTMTAALAEETKPAIVLGTGALENPFAEMTENKTNYCPRSYVYLGTADAAPVRWRVLDAEKASDGATAGVFLLSEYTLEDGVLFHPTDGKYKNGCNVWQGSTAQAWCQNFVSTAMNGVERAALLGVNKTEAAGRVSGIAWRECVLTDADLAFFLSVQEMLAYLGDYYRGSARQAKDANGTGKHWWLRSGSSLYNYTAGILESTGTLTHVDVDLTHLSARPAVNLNARAVAFTASAGSKAAGADGLAPVGAASGNDYHLTLLDKERIFAAQERQITAEPAGTFNVHYTDAKTGDGEYISAIVLKGGEAIFYGRLAAAASADGSAEVTLPASLPEGDYELLVFNEQVNGDNRPDVCSDFSNIALTVRTASVVTPTPEPTATPAPEVPATGDGAHPAAWVGLALLAVMLLSVRRKAARG